MDGYATTGNPDDYGPENPSAQLPASSEGLLANGYASDTARDLGDAQDHHSVRPPKITAPSSVRGN